MNLLLWRHATAEDGVNDMARDLTPRGHRQAAQIARWLEHRLPADYVLLASPANRAMQTAQALSGEFEILPVLAPGARPEEVVRAVNWPHGGRTVIVVGHQPTLGGVAALLLSGSAMSWSVKKGGLWWIASRDREEGSSVVLRAVIAPDLV